MQVRGVVERDAYVPGSKSEHEATYLHAEDGTRWVLRRVGANPYIDPEIDALVGKTIDASGRPHGDVFFLEAWEDTVP